MSSNDPFEYLQHKLWLKEWLVEPFFWLTHTLLIPRGFQMCVPNKKHQKSKGWGMLPCS
jgi:hypothetical protein